MTSQSFIFLLVSIMVLEQVVGLQVLTKEYAIRKMNTRYVLCLLLFLHHLIIINLKSLDENPLPCL